MNPQASLNRFRPRHAALASASTSQHYRQAQVRAVQTVVVRSRLPRTQQDFYNQRLNKR